MTTCIETDTGGFFDFAAPSPVDVRLHDIAGALSKLCRFNGHCKRFYSVAEHALLVRRLVVEGPFHPRLTLAALHHDSHEAYLGDIPTPLKALLGDVVPDMADRIDAAIAAAYGLQVRDFHHLAVKWADRMALRMEAYHLKASRGLDDHWGFPGPPPFDPPWELGLSPDDAAQAFIDIHLQEAARP